MEDFERDRRSQEERDVSPEAEILLKAYEGCELLQAIGSLGAVCIGKMALSQFVVEQGVEYTRNRVFKELEKGSQEDREQTERLEKAEEARIIDLRRASRRIFEKDYPQAV